MNITICGAGNAAHTLIPVLAATGAHTLTVYTPLVNEVERWHAALSQGAYVEAAFADGRRLSGRPAAITADPATAGRSADLVLLALPAFAHETVLCALAPYLSPAAWIGALPARGGFEWLVRQVLPDHRGVIFGLQTLPWACRIQRWGRQVEVLGVKNTVDLAASQGPVDASSDAAGHLSQWLAIAVQPVSSFLALTLANTGQIIHPGIMAGLFRTWDGQPFGEDQVPLFYGGVDDPTARLLQGLSDDVQAVRAELQSRAPHLDLSPVLSLYDWLRRAYAGQIADDSTLRAAFNSNRAYAGLAAPMELIEENAYVPWFGSRYLAEDVPFGLLVTRGIAELVGVPTPTVDEVIGWAQQKLSKQYLVGGRVVGRDIGESRAPQRFGIHTVEQLLLEA